MAVRAYHVELCAGSGMLGLGLALGCEYAGIDLRTVAYVEREAYAAANLVARMEDKALDRGPIWDDVKTLCDSEFLGYVRQFRPLVVSGGYPCQPFSCAGKRLGEADGRHLWPHIARFLDVARPEICFFENVDAHLKHGFDSVFRDLRSMDYRIEPGVYSAEEVGAKHRRKRLFILAVQPNGIVADYERRQWGAGTASGEWAPREGLREGIETMALRPDGGRGELRQPSGSAGLADRGGASVGDTARYDELRMSESTMHGEREPTRRSDRQLADAGHEYEHVQQRRLWAEHTRGGDAMADAENHNRGQGEQGEQERGRCRFAGSCDAMADGAGGSLPLFAPGPGEFERWRDILDTAPNLAPATERELCRTPDGLAYRLDTDRLRLTGNGVVPLAAAYAFCALWAAVWQK